MRPGIDSTGGRYSSAKKRSNSVVLSGWTLKVMCRSITVGPSWRMHRQLV